jgi:hypothetical protein
MPISFEEEQKLLQQTSVSVAAFRGMSGWLVKKGLAANQTSADLTLVVLAAVFLGLAAFFFLHANKNGYTSGPAVNAAIQYMRETTRGR